MDGWVNQMDGLCTPPNVSTHGNGRPPRSIDSLLLAAVMLAAKHCSTDANAAGGQAWNYTAYAKASGLAEGELKVGGPSRTCLDGCVWGGMMHQAAGKQIDRPWPPPFSSLNETQVLEVEMLKALSYDLVVPPRQLYDYGSKVIGWKRQAMFRPENP